MYRSAYPGRGRHVEAVEETAPNNGAALSLHRLAQRRVLWAAYFHQVGTVGLRQGENVLGGGPVDVLHHAVLSLHEDIEVLLV